MNWATAHRYAMLAAFEAHEDLALDTFERIDVFEAIVADGLKLFFRDLSTSAACYVPARLGSRAGAIVNARHPLPLQRYSAAHEYGHHRFGHGEQRDREPEPRGRCAGLSDEEKLAEAFAAWFLMPPEAAAPALERIGCSRPATPADAYALALRLGTSYRATCSHLPSLKLASEYVADEWRETPVKTLKQHLSPVPPPGGWHHDVWRLTERDVTAPLVVRAGDRVLLELPGWSLAALPDGATGEEVPPADLLSVPRWAVDLATDMSAGPTCIELADYSTRLRFTLVVERPIRGRFTARQWAVA